jgi:hypothetical protein
MKNMIPFKNCTWGYRKVNHHESWLLIFYCIISNNGKFHFLPSLKGYQKCKRRKLFAARWRTEHRELMKANMEPIACYHYKFKNAYSCDRKAAFNENFYDVLCRMVMIFFVDFLLMRLFFASIFKNFCKKIVF